MSLSQAERKFLRGRGHALKPVVIVGGAGLTDAVLTELEGALSHHELVKVSLRIGNRERRDTLLDELLDRSKATLLQRIGNMALLYRQAEQPKLLLSKTL